MDINLIGISGRIGSGKDTFAKMIKLAIFNKMINPFSSGEEFEQYWNSKSYDPEFPYCDGWEIKKFATPLKQIACILIRCTMEQLEDQDFKDSYLGTEWDTIEIPSYCSWIIYKGDYNNPPREYRRRKMTVRGFLQKLGTEAIRKQVHDNAWVNALFKDYKIGFHGMRHASGFPAVSLPKWIITDMRFPNEAKALKDRGALILRIERRKSDQVDSSQLHESETALDNYDGFNQLIQNHGDLEHLYELAKTLVNTYKLS